MGKHRKDWHKNLVETLDNNLFEGEAVLNRAAVDDLHLEELEELSEPIDVHQAEMFFLGDAD